MKVRPKKIELEAYQWSKYDSVVREFDDPFYNNSTCNRCLKLYKAHGILANSSNILICPGMWMIEGLTGIYFPVSNKDFEEKYEIVE